MKLRALEVYEVNSYIKRILVNDPILFNLRVRGEISNLKVHSSKNIYFSLKDEKSKINCVIFKKNYDENFNLENGMKIIANGYISSYEKEGAYQLYVNSIDVEGIGNLYIEFNKLKQKLHKEGLFDNRYKKSIPYIPSDIGIITSPTGAAIRDIINVISRRYPKINIKIYPVLVQGSKSAQDICEAIDFLNNKGNVDVIIMGRGGGSIEELWSFNEEVVARAIFNSKIPIISAIGHETDFTIADFVADMRAPTPSAAAEIATPFIEDLEYKLDSILNRINSNILNRVVFNKQKIDNINNSINRQLKDYLIKDKIIQLDKIYDKISIEVSNKINIENEKLSNIGTVLHSLSPLSTIDRGYCIIQKENEIINNIEAISIDDRLDIVLKNGDLKCKVETITKKEV